MGVPLIFLFDSDSTRSPSTHSLLLLYMQVLLVFLMRLCRALRGHSCGLVLLGFGRYWTEPTCQTRAECATVLCMLRAPDTTKCPTADPIKRP